MNDNTSRKLRVVAQAVTYAEELTGTPTGAYLKVLLTNMVTNEPFYFAQLESAVIEAEKQVIAPSKLRTGEDNE